MNVQIVGIQPLDFVADDGKRIKGNKLHLLYLDERVNGTAVNTIFVKDDFDLSGIELGKMYQLSYDFNFKGRGRLIGINPVD